MLRNYLKIALRTLWRNRLYALLNGTGLALGLTVVVLALLYVRDEHRFDQFHTNNPHLYRITTTTRLPDGQWETNGGTGQVQGPTFGTSVPEVRAFVRVMGGDISDDFRVGTKALKLQPLYVDANFLEVFTFPLLHGDPRTALREVNDVVVTERTARRFFGRTDVVGRVLHLDGNPSAQKLAQPVRIAGVVQDPPRQSSLQFDVLHPFSFMQVSFTDTDWLNAYLGTFVWLRPDADPAAVNRKFNQLFALHARSQRLDRRKQGQPDPQIQYGLQRLTDVHLNPLDRRNGNREAGVVNGSKPVFSYLFLGIAGFVLLMASINFVNSSIAGSLQRAREVGVRKVTGGRQGQILGQFLGESALLASAAFGLALLLARAVLPVFNSLTGKQFSFREALDAPLLAGFGGLLLLNVLLAGLYPAWVLARLKPTEVLTSRYRRVPGRAGFRQGLVVGQFTMAIALLIASFVFYQQMQYLRTKPLGYQPRGVIRSYIPGNQDEGTIRRFLAELRRDPAIESLSFGGEYGGGYQTRLGDRSVQTTYYAIDEQYLPTLGIRLKAGRNFLPTAGNPPDEVLVNEAFVQAAGLTRPLGTRLQPDPNLGPRAPVTIVGVVHDFHFGSLKERIRPLALLRRGHSLGGIWAKVAPHRSREARAAFERAFRQTMPGAVYEYDFLDDLNAGAYDSERRWQQIIGYATGLSLLICCLGLFGLAHLSAQQRTKEIGIRKVLGASVGGIVALLSREFLTLVFGATLLAIPLAWWGLSRWLQEFAYRVEITWSVVAGAGLLAVGVALLTVSAQSIKAARMNPVKSLRME
jgi:putative ABC transport system permease protein